MRLKIELTWMHGVLSDDDPHAPHEPLYALVDAETNRRLAERDFATCLELEAYIAAHYPGAERCALAPPSDQDKARLVKLLALFEQGDAARPFNPVLIRSALASDYYELGFPEETRQRMRHVMGLGG